ncbi:TerB family tellurite resistance protein [Pseudofulvibacter geojedonensis]|uniref:TerB family tellurite resistance protein n=1 Tax=Pseudofulvibacter geojedonensis TaxID=1123758 RepID=A0ABW3I074_9FLAO
MISEHRLYQTFGELLYLVAMADGVVTKNEIDKLDEILKDHPASENIKWSFNYEMQSNNSIDNLYKKIIETYSDNGPDEAYDFFINALRQLAAADGNLDKKEEILINQFSSDLINRFSKDLEK